jgi:hypothetical protein
VKGADELQNIKPGLMRLNFSTHYFSFAMVKAFKLRAREEEEDGDGLEPCRASREKGN